MPEQYGILGVGALASAIVTGLCEGLDEPARVTLSPRNATTAARLANRFPSVTVANDNQAVIDDADLIVVCLRQTDANVVGDLIWRPDQVVVSAVAGLPMRQLTSLVEPATPVRAVPMPEVANRSSVTPVHPPLEPAVMLFDRLGGTLPIEQNNQFEAIFTALGTVAPFLEYLTVLASFLTDHGLSNSAAQQLLTDSFSGLLSTLEAAEDPDFAAMIPQYAPRGGGNAQLTALMHESGVFDRTRTALDEVHRRLTEPTS